MTSSWRHLPVAARPIAAAANAAIAAAREHDGEALAETVADLAALDPAQVNLILGTAVRLLLEDTHPDGLDGDDVRTVLEHCVRAAAGWQPEVDPHVPRHTAVAAHLHEADGDLVTAARSYAEAARAASNLAERDHLVRQAARLNQRLRG